SRRSQYHQSMLGEHVDPFSAGTASRLHDWTQHFWAHGADSFTAGRRALAMVYRETVGQAQLLAYADDFPLISLLSSSLPVLILASARVRPGDSSRESRAAREGAVAAE